MLVGYARVSTHEQSLALQQDALAKAGCDRTYTDVISGVAIEREGLAAARARGRLGGRKRVLSPTQVEAARGLMADPTRPIADVCAAMRVSRATLYRYVPIRTDTYRYVPTERRRPALPPPPRAHPPQLIEPASESVANAMVSG